MNKDQTKGKLDQAKGKAKKAWGELTNDKKTKAEGSADKTKGAIQEKFGNAKETVNDNLNKHDRK